MERKLTAILCADVYGYSRLMGEDEEATLRTLSSHRKIIDGFIEQHRGRFVNSAGDSVLAEFASVVEAVNSAVDIQSTLKTENAKLAADRRMEFRIGVNLGDVMIEGEQIYGDGVNVAARLESLAEPGGICISGTVHEQVRDRLECSYEDRGEQTVKNIARPVHVWRVLLDVSEPEPSSVFARVSWRMVSLSFLSLMVIATTGLIIRHISFRSPQVRELIPQAENPSLALPEKPSIAVLPFENLSNDPNQEYFSDGLTDQVIDQLSHIPGLFVIARNSSFSFRGKAADEREVGRKLGVKYVLEGSVRRAADQFRIGVELVDASTGEEVWAQDFTRPLKGVFAVQDEIVGNVVKTLDLLIQTRTLPLDFWMAKRTPNLEAFDDFLRAAVYTWRFTKADDQKAREWSEHAVKLDPQYADAYALQAATYSRAVLFQWSTDPTADLRHAYQVAQQALSIDDANSVALVVVCAVNYLGKRFDEAVAECQRSVAINPNYAGGYVELSSALLFADRPQEALQAAQTAMRLDPIRADFYSYFVASPLVLMGRYQEAVSLLRHHLAAYPDQVWGHVLLVVAYTELGLKRDAISEAGQVKRINPQFDVIDLNKSPAVNRLFHRDLHEAGLN